MLGANKSCVLCCCALKRTGTFAAESKDVFILIDFRRSDVLMFHSRHQSVCQQLFQDWEKFKFFKLIDLRNTLFNGFVKSEIKQWFSAYHDQFCA